MFARHKGVEVARRILRQYLQAPQIALCCALQHYIQMMRDTTLAASDEIAKIRKTKIILESYAYM